MQRTRGANPSGTDALYENSDNFLFLPQNWDSWGAFLIKKVGNRHHGDRLNIMYVKIPEGSNINSYKILFKIRRGLFLTQQFLSPGDCVNYNQGN